MFFSSFYDENGNFLRAKFSYFFGVFLFFNYFSGVIIYYYFNSEIINPFIVLISFYDYFVFNILLTQTIPEEFLNLNIFVLSYVFIISLIFLFSFHRYNKIQQKLYFMGLYGYYLFFKFFNIYYFKPKIGSKIKYSIFIKEFENLKQLFSKGSVSFSRFGNSGIKVIFNHNLPSIKELSKININDYLKEDYIFLGFSGGVYKKKLPVYLSFSKLLHFGNFGSSGRGKSNTLNQIMVSIFKNFHYVNLFFFIDFKGNIEGNTYQLLEEKLQTNRIYSFSNNKNDLFKLLTLLTIINLSRQKYIVKNKIKKITNSLIFVNFDEVAEILNYKAITKEEKEIQLLSNQMIESLFATGRSSGFRISFSTQSYTQNASGITNIMKTNIETKITHFLDEEQAILSIFPDKTILEKEGININEFLTGEYVLKTEGSKLYHARSIYIPESVDIFVELLSSIISKKEIVNIDINNEILEVLNDYQETQFYSTSEILEDLTILKAYKEVI